MRNHPSHPALVHFPIAFWVTASICDLIGHIYPAAWTMGNGCLVLGNLTAILAVGSGIWQLPGISASAAMEKVITRHISAAATAYIFYLVALVLRVEEGEIHAPSGLATASSSIALLLLLAAGWLGGTLVYRHGAGVSEQARERSGN